MHFSFLPLDLAQGQDPRAVLALIAEARVGARAGASHVLCLSLDHVPNLSPNQDHVLIHLQNQDQIVPWSKKNLVVAAGAEVWAVIVKVGADPSLIRAAPDLVLNLLKSVLHHLW